MSVPDVELTARLVGLPLPELWGRYVAVGGNSSFQALTARVSGRLSWPAREELFLAVALNDALIDESIVAMNPLADLLGDGGQPRASAPPAVARARRTGPGRSAAGVTADLDELRGRAREARALARVLRGAAQAARRRATRPRGGQTPAVWPLHDHRWRLTDARRLDDLLQCPAQILWRADADGRVREESPTWQAFTGRSMVQRGDRGWLDAVHPVDRRHAEENWRSCVTGDMPVRTHVRLWNAAASAWELTRVRAVPVHSAPGRTSGWVGTNTVVGA